MFNLKNIKLKNKLGFSLVELLVAIAILAVLTAVFVPAIMNYTEHSRSGVDAAATNEIVNAIEISTSNFDALDEIYKNSKDNNVSCYIDQKDEKNYGSSLVGVKEQNYTFKNDTRVAKMQPYYAAGNMYGMTITFEPVFNASSNDSIYVLENGIINKFLPDGGAYLSTCPNLYKIVSSTIGDELIQISNMYKNSEFTVFISVDAETGQTSIYGQYSGINLRENVVKNYNYERAEK